MIAAAAQQDAAFRERWVGCMERREDAVGRHADFVVDVIELAGNPERVKGLALHRKEALRADSAAGAVFGPLMVEQG